MRRVSISLIGFLVVGLGLGFLTASPVSAQEKGIITTVAGGGPNNLPAIDANLSFPAGVAVDSVGNLYLAAQLGSRIFKVDLAGTLTVVAGNGVFGFSGDGGPAADASLMLPFAVAVDSGGTIFIADERDHRIRRVDAATGIITTVAGNGVFGFSGDGGPATDASLNGPTGLAVDSGGTLFIADQRNHRIRRVDASTGIITTVTGNGSSGFSGDGGPATDASLRRPTGLAVVSGGNLYIADTGNRRIRRVDASTGIITTVAGNGTSGFSGDGGPATDASLKGPFGVAVDSGGNLYIADSFNHRIRRVDSSTGIITTAAGNGTCCFSGDGFIATKATLSRVTGVEIDKLGNLFIADESNHRVRVVDASTGIITTVAGNGLSSFSGDGGPGTSASLCDPWSVAIDGGGNLYIADQCNHRIRVVDAATGAITTVAGSGSPGFNGDGGPATSASFETVTKVAVDGDGNLFIADTLNHRIRRVDPSTGIITTVAGNGSFGFSGDGGPATDASLNAPLGVAVDSDGNLFIADQRNHRIRRVDTVTGNITTVVGNGLGGFSGDGGRATDASLWNPSGVEVNNNGDIFIADTANQRIRRVDGGSRIISTVAGNGTFGFRGDGELATRASLAFPLDVAVKADRIYIADRLNGRIRMFVLPENQPPVAEAGPDQIVIVSEEVRFAGSASTDPDGTIVEYQWDFGDGATGAMDTTFHTYTAAGVFTVALTVTDDDGATGSDTALVTVKTIADAMQELIDVVASFNLQQGISNSLDSKLDNAVKALEAKNAGQRSDAMNKLQAFINEVEAQRGKELTDAQADELIALATRILSVI